MRVQTIGVVLLCAFFVSPANAQPTDDDGGGAGAEDQYDEAAPGEPVADVEVFYDRLSDDGTWVDDPAAGHVFIPETPNYVPYRNGHWSRTSVGFVWVSDERFAWATTHYGRWAYSNAYSRWVWAPDTTWGPSWVDWRESGDHFGWAPMAPEVVIRGGYVTPVGYWNYVPGNRILEVNVGRYYVPRERVVVFHRGGAPIEHFAHVGGARVIVGPPAARLHAYHLTGAAYRPVKIEARLSGRMTAVESRAAVQRAHERHDVVQQRNQKRIEANPKIREVHNNAPHNYTPPAHNTTPPHNTTTPPHNTTPPQHNNYTPPPAHNTTTPPHNTTPPPAHNTTTPPRNNYTPPPAHNTPPPAHNTTLPPAHNTTPPPRNNYTPPPAHNTTPPPRNNYTPPPAHNTPPPAHNTPPPAHNTPPPKKY